MVVLLGVAALVLDLGTSYDHDRELQAAADAGALAGAQQLIYDAGQASSVTRSYVNQNASHGDANSSVQAGNISFQQLDVAERSVFVSLTESHVPFSFARALGMSEGTVSARAKAELMYLTGIPQVAPVAIPYLDPAKFKVHVGRSSNHEVGTFDLNKAGAGMYSGGTGQTLWSRYADDYLLWLSAEDEDGKDLMAPLVVGSVYVPSAHSLIRKVELSRPNAGGQSETVGVTVYTAGLPSGVNTLPIIWRLNNSGSWHRVSLTNNGAGLFSGSFGVSPGGTYTGGVATVSIEAAARSTWGDWGGEWWGGGTRRLVAQPLVLVRQRTPRHVRDVRRVPVDSVLQAVRIQRGGRRQPTHHVRHGRHQCLRSERRKYHHQLQGYLLQELIRSGGLG